MKNFFRSSAIAVLLLVPASITAFAASIDATHRIVQRFGSDLEHFRLVAGLTSASLIEWGAIALFDKRDPLRSIILWGNSSLCDVSSADIQESSVSGSDVAAFKILFATQEISASCFGTFYRLAEGQPVLLLRDGGATLSGRLMLSALSVRIEYLPSTNIPLNLTRRLADVAPQAQEFLAIGRDRFAYRQTDGFIRVALVSSDGGSFAEVLICKPHPDLSLATEEPLKSLSSPDALAVHAVHIRSPYDILAYVACRQEEDQ